MANLILRNIRPRGEAETDLLIEGGRIKAYGRQPDLPGVAVEDGRGAILWPGLVDAHTHLDKNLLGLGWHVNNRAAVLQGRIDFERENRTALGIDPHRQSMRHALELVRTGATHIRSHVDIDTTHGLSVLEGVLRTREELAGIIDIQIVAFPQSGVMVRPGTVELLDEALAMGCEVLGGLDPCGIDRDPKGQLDAIFGLAEKHGKPIDFHLHELGELGAFTLGLILDRVRTHSMAGKVDISHAFTLGAPDVGRVSGQIEELAALDIGILTTGAPSAPVPSMKQCRAAGIRFAGGCDGVRDTWGPWNLPDMMDRARIIGQKNGVRSDIDLRAVLEVVSEEGAKILRAEGYGLEPGCHADFLLFDAETLGEAVVQPATIPLVVKGGRVTARDGVSVKVAP